VTRAPWRMAGSTIVPIRGRHGNSRLPAVRDEGPLILQTLHDPLSVTLGILPVDGDLVFASCPSIRHARAVNAGRRCRFGFCYPVRCNPTWDSLIRCKLSLFLCVGNRLLNY
jgi:hypothetical protein